MLLRTVQVPLSDGHVGVSRPLPEEIDVAGAVVFASGIGVRASEESGLSTRCRPAVYFLGLFGLVPFCSISKDLAILRSRVSAFLALPIQSINSFLREYESDSNDGPRG